MAKVNSFEELEVWKLARVLAGKIHSFAAEGDFCKDYGFKDQIQRAAVSIVSNVAEGFERQSNNQFLHFLDIAIGSAGEVRARLYLAFDFGYIDRQQFLDATSDAKKIGRMLTKLMQYLRTVPNRPDDTPIKPSNRQTAPSNNRQTIKPSNGQTDPGNNRQTVKPSNRQTIP